MILETGGRAVIPSPRTHIYILEQKGYGCKIGISSDPQRRISDLRTGNPGDIQLSYLSRPYIRGAASEIECRVHLDLRPVRLKGEWFRVTPQYAKDRVVLHEGRVQKYIEEWFYPPKVGAKL